MTTALDTDHFAQSHANHPIVIRSASTLSYSKPDPKLPVVAAASLISNLAKKAEGQSVQKL